MQKLMFKNILDVLFCNAVTTQIGWAATDSINKNIKISNFVKIMIAYTVQNTGTIICKLQTNFCMAFGISKQVI